MKKIVISAAAALAGLAAVIAAALRIKTNGARRS